jgi:hypothetical protein
MPTTTHTTTKEAWESRLQAEYDAKNITSLERKALVVLLTFRGHGGRIFPAHQSIADRVTHLYRRCSERTVRRALDRARDLGLLFWLPQRKRVGWRSLQTSNLYFVNVPAGPVKPGPKRVWPHYSTAGQAGRVQDQEVSKRADKDVWITGRVRTVAEQLAILAQG